MGIRDRLKNKVKGMVDRFSGENSAAAPEEIKPFERNLPPDDSVKIVKAKLERPRERRTKKKSE